VRELLQAGADLVGTSSAVQIVLEALGASDPSGPDPRSDY
jgi:hypothetical protein